MDVLYLLSLVACLLVTVWSRQYKRFPLFAASTLAAILFQIAYDPHSPQWLRDAYPSAVSFGLAIRVLAVGEAFVKSAAGMKHRKLIAVSALSFALLFASVIAWRFTSGDALASAIHARRVVVVGLAAFLGTYMLLMWTTGYKRSGVADNHVMLMFCACTVMAGSAVLRMAYPGENWAAWNDSAYAANTFVYLIWALLFGTPAPQHGRLRLAVRS
jgi:hypothetical protein